LTQTHNHASIPPLNFYRLDTLPAAQPTNTFKFYLASFCNGYDSVCKQTLYRA